MSYNWLRNDCISMNNENYKAFKQKVIKNNVF